MHIRLSLEAHPADAAMVAVADSGDDELFSIDPATGAVVFRVDGVARELRQVVVAVDSTALDYDGFWVNFCDDVEICSFSAEAFAEGR